MAQNPRAMGMAFSGKNPFDNKPKAAGAAAQASAKDTNVLGALNKINAAALDTPAQIKLLDDHLTKQNIKTQNHADVKQYIMQMQTANPQGTSGINADDIATKIVAAANASRPPPPAAAPATPAAKP